VLATDRTSKIDAAPTEGPPLNAPHLTESLICARTKEKSIDYKFLANLQQEFTIPEKGILSNVLQKDEFVNITAFGFAAGQELSAHSAPTPAVLYFLEGEAEVQLGEDRVQAQAGSFVYMPPMLPHGISAKSPVKMLLVQIKAGLNNAA
jgi:quercetin dioxygenase-like cupin family protein